MKSGNKMKKTIWILADDRMGNVNQLLGVAEHLGWPYERKNIIYDKWVKLPNFLRWGCQGVCESSRVLLTAPWPDVVLSAGRRTFPVAHYIKKQSGGQTKIVQLMSPGWIGMMSADLVVLPEHDQYRGHQPNVISICGTPHRVTTDRLIQERQKWEPIFHNYPHLRIGLIVGGATKNKPFTPEMARFLVENVRTLNPKSVLVTTSRRTPQDVIEILQTQLPGPLFMYRFGDKQDNPYFGLLACSDKLVVTGDSMSMCTECCASGKPVYIFAPKEMISAKHHRFHESLYRQKAAYNLLSGTDLYPIETLKNPAEIIANHIRSLF